MLRPDTTLLATATLALVAGAASAQTAVGLAGDRTLVMIDISSAAVTGMMEVEGVERLHGIDWRPGNMTLIGVNQDQEIVVIDPATATVTSLSQMNTMLDIADGAPVIVDVNPMADRLRFMSGTMNHRVNMDTGEVTVDGALNWAEGDASADSDFAVAATGYINSYGTPEATAMYNIDTGLSSLLQQTAPNDGTNATIGALGVTLDGPIGFDVATDAEGTNTAWLAAMRGLHTVDLETGMISESWEIDGLDVDLRDITILPAM